MNKKQIREIVDKLNDATTEVELNEIVYVIIEASTFDKYMDKLNDQNWRKND